MIAGLENMVETQRKCNTFDIIFIENNPTIFTSICKSIIRKKQLVDSD